MNNLTRFDPLNQLTRFEPWGDIDNLFRGFMVRPMFQDMPTGPQMKLDVTEDAKAYTIKADIPGVQKEDIDISVDGKLVTISAEVKKEVEKKEGKKVVHSERYYGQVSRSFTIDCEVDSGSAKATYTNGVLEAVLPKKPGSVTKQITVS